MKRYDEALGLKGVYDIFSVRADFVFLMGLVYMNNGLLDDAISQFKKAATMGESVVEGINSYRSYYNIGVIYECSGHLDEARKYYRRCGGYEPAKRRLREMGG